MASSQNASGPVVKEHLYKVLVIGEFGVGKHISNNTGSRFSLSLHFQGR